MAEGADRYVHQEVEKKWMQTWEEWGIYRWDPERPREETFAVDSPPPTVSGSLHIGHVFSYTHQDLLVRYQRMRGKNIAYPMGWDDNGLPTERRVQNLFNIRCNPHLPYQPDWRPRRDFQEGEPPVEVSRRNFIEACQIVTREDEAAFEALWRHLGLSIDWTLQYATIDAHCRRISQWSFLDLYEKGQVYSLEAPTMWDVDFQTAVAQAEVEDRVKKGAFHDIRFGVEGGGEFVISTTRPELLGACIAVVAHPDDERYRHLFGKTALTPLFYAPVPILPSPHADPEKGTGILMVCTFGDSADVEFWKSSGLPLKQLVGRDGRMLEVTYGEAPYASTHPEKARQAYSELAGLTVAQARRKIAALLAQEGSAVGGHGAALVGQPREVEQVVKFYEKGERPLEFVPTRQWFVRLLEHRSRLLEQGRKIQWHPGHMRHRYEHWVEGLNQDWCISRQRFFGVSFPVWYRLDAQGQPDYDHPIMASKGSLPVDPMSEPPPGYTEDQRGKPGGFVGDPDVMDTWATSSLTPQIVSHWFLDPQRHRRLFPMDVRPQSHEIIRTWAFYTIVKALLHENTVPWHHVVISGWILDPERKKMSKSRGNVVTPQHLLDRYSADAVRYWAARASLGVDTAYDESVFKVGGKLVTKIFNAGKFVQGRLEKGGLPDAEIGVQAISEPLDTSFVQHLSGVIARATEAYDQFDYATALRVAELDFWDFCDDYLELVKRRADLEQDSPGKRSGLATLRWALSVYLRLLAPSLPYVTEEVFSRLLADRGFPRSVHISPWPRVDEVQAVPATTPAELYECACEVLTKVRGAKTEAKKNLRWPVVALEVTGSAPNLRLLEAVLPDLCRAGAVAEGAVRLAEGPPPEGERFSVQVTLGSEAAA